MLAHAIYFFPVKSEELISQLEKPELKLSQVQTYVCNFVPNIASNIAFSEITSIFLITPEPPRVSVRVVIFCKSLALHGAFVPVECY